jgi:hypothetical protein
MFERCQISGYERNAHHDARGRRGWCSAHYQRWKRHGDPLAGGTLYGEPQAAMAEAIAFVGEDCLIWKFGKSGGGYGQIQVKGKKLYVHRVVCEAANGPPPSPDREAAHSCGNGHLGCCNPAHLRWATQSENMDDRVIHGTSNRGERSRSAKLTEADVLEIRSLRGTVLQRELAARFGVNPRTIGDVLSGKKWAWLDQPARNT